MERIIIDIVIEREITEEKILTGQEDKIAFILSKKYNDVIANDTKWKKDNNARKYIISYILLASEFRLY